MNTAIKVERPRAPANQDPTLGSEYVQSLHMIERLHHLLLDVIKDEFDRTGSSDLNAVQALLLYNMGDNELTAGELKSRGYYLGSNVSYNLKKLVEMGYVDYERSETDKRSVRVSLSAKGRQAAAVVNRLYQRQLGSVETVAQVSGEELKGLNKALGRLERFWIDQIRFRL
ncbi:MAG: winged helix DNA-binding protein [Hyphomicrobium sp.]|jgi:DNA-binding MarR family transcriptional regulator|uniref:transcriptional regulator LdtR n=1 Tax=Hyphomicrobium sp. TaxID=82 RepID=UPI0025BAED37|nr:winged helix DNA-binding protein [Hyphomicrobium sp.]MBX9862684.1 winged helix DNA-binding protein [Hyphomicrobium sp.]